MEFPFVERTLPLIKDEHISNYDTDVAIYALGRISGEGTDRFNEQGDYLFMEEEFYYQRIKIFTILFFVYFFIFKRH